jgi:prepilin-type N-terminal cleavage/methylation domain-containing protein/prepilin-type processing-associated H-X9-DG protein
MRFSSARPAFTLVELLVVIAIIGTLMGLLLPAVQSAREAGRRNTCSNNLNQLGKAILQYDSQKQSLPGWKNPSPNQANTSSGTFFGAPSWPVMLMPFIERRDVFQTYQTTAAASLATAPATNVFISLFACPTAPVDSTSAPYIAYAGNVGSAATAATTVAQRKADGAMQDNTVSRMNLDAISAADGTVNTLLFTERNGSGLASQTYWNVIATSTLANPSPLVVGTGTGAHPGFGFLVSGSTATKYINNTTDTSGLLPSANHPGGVVASFCDGHTRFLSDSIAGPVYGQLLTVNSSGGNTSPVALTLTGSGASMYTLSDGDY